MGGSCARTARRQDFPRVTARATRRPTRMARLRVRRRGTAGGLLRHRARIPVASLLVVRAATTTPRPPPPDPFRHRRPRAEPRGRAVTAFLLLAGHNSSPPFYQIGPRFGRLRTSNFALGKVGWMQVDGNGSEQGGMIRTFLVIVYSSFRPHRIHELDPGFL